MAASEAGHTTRSDRGALSAIRTKVDEACGVIKRAIDEGIFGPGEQLVESRVCKKLGLRRGPVREALLLLHWEGLVRKQGAYKGHVVRFAEDISPGPLLQRYEWREQIASGACRLAAKYMNGWQIDAVATLAQQLDESELHEDREQRYKASYEFHNFLLANCSNVFMREVWETNHLMPPRMRSHRLEVEVVQKTSDWIQSVSHN